ncbi:hypothetical protein L226DRAFT_612914 [Lentinus tigrinus ALCF2SS1-7]|uniref:Uncharacterized protein n=1 Tax=Lentinus tigrinus ALCF2SS1-6 TaxID=1328759 RepID=A0A5C2SBJ0_9APHY|nr:hypothetical protein L227DRAFT_652966 [Lentinus tigrinus ALCF2SS1-6]RPD75290.1 hypothetical protein L226DRAFT_612914 [Lentinus tigrinus ALCF2SS1-7]
MTGVLAAMAQFLKRDPPTETWPDRRNGRRSKSATPDVVRLLVDLEEYNPEDESICCPHNCSHCYSPPSLVYSSASCSSLTLTPSTVYTPPSSVFSASNVALASSPKGITLSDGTSLFPLPELDVVTSTIAQRRGISKLPALKPKPRNANVPSFPGSKNKSLSPVSPDSSTFAQRFVGFMRLSSRPDPDPLLEIPSPRDYVEDPFGRASAPFYEDAYLFDASPVPHPDLYDITIYRALPVSDDKHYYTERCPKHGKARLYIGVSDIDPPAPTTDTPSPPQQLKARRPGSQTKLPDAPPPTPVTTSAPPRSNLRPLLLAQKLAQAESIVPPTGPKLRPLYLPQHLARGVSHPPRRSIPHSRSNTFPFGPKAPALRSFSDTGAPGKNHAGQGHAKSPSRVLQLNGIVSLLEVLEDGQVADLSVMATFGSRSGSEDSLAANASTTGPALVLPSAHSIPSFALDSPGPQDLPQPVSRKVEDILELLSASPSVASRLSIESVVTVHRDLSVCAYAL